MSSFALLLLTACAPDVSVSQVRGEFLVSPTVTDVGMVGVGETLEFNLQLDHVDGPRVDLRNVTVQWVEGGGFEVIDFPEELEPFGTGFVVLEFTPPYAGFHRSTLSIVSDGEESVVEAELRGRGGGAGVQIWPLVLDFGQVDPGEHTTMDLTVASVGEASLTYSVSVLGGEDFSSSSTEVVVAAGAEATQTVSVAAPDDDVLRDTLVVTTDDPAHTTWQIPLRANDCEQGSAHLYDEDSDGVTSCAGDCDDDDPRIHPGAQEDWDEVDQDCDGEIDEGTIGADDDEDGYSEFEGDCNDADPEVGPDGTEIANGVDDDCDGVVDDGVGADDSDGDGYASWADDCDDADADTYPGAPELEDGVDNDCDGDIDEGTTLYDDDGDHYTEADGDCDDTDADIKPGSAEAENGVDDDCDGDVDEGTRSYDDDGDGFTERGGDCDDTDAEVNPGAPEDYDDDIDNDCDGTVDG